MAPELPQQENGCHGILWGSIVPWRLHSASSGEDNVHPLPPHWQSSPAMGLLISVSTVELMQKKCLCVRLKSSPQQFWSWWSITSLPPQNISFPHFLQPPALECLLPIPTSAPCCSVVYTDCKATMVLDQC